MSREIDQKTIHAERGTADTPAEGHQRLVLKFGDTRTGTLVGFTARGEPLVDYAGNPTLGHLAARSCVDVQRSDLGREVVLLFDGGDSARPLLIGVLRAPAPEHGSSEASVSAEIEVDGEHRVVSAKDRLTLRCGRASISLTSDGRVHIRGTWVQSDALNTNRMTGGSVSIN